MKTPKNPLGNFQPVYDIDIEKYGYKTAIVLARIRRRCDSPKGYCWESIPNMAKGLKMSVSVVRHIVHSLEESGEIMSEPQTGKSSHIFVSTPIKIDTPIRNGRGTPTKNGTTTPIRNGSTQETKEETIHDTEVVVPKRYLDYAISQGAKHPEQYARACFDRGVLEKKRKKKRNTQDYLKGVDGYEETLEAP